MKALFLLFAFSASAFARSSDVINGFVDIGTRDALYTEYRPAKNGKPTLFLANGLTYSTQQWQEFIQALKNIDPEVGVVAYDMRGMGRTLLANAPANYDIPFSDQVDDLHRLKEHFKIKGPTAVLGLSYGGAVALDIAVRFPNDFDQIIAMSPFLERIPEQDALIKNSVLSHRLFFPLDPRTDEELYNLYLRLLVFSTYPSVEPIVLENPFKLEAVYRMVKGAKDWQAVQVIAKLPLQKVNIIAALDDEYVKFDRMQIFLKNIPKNQIGSVALFENTKHKIPEERARLAAAWVFEILHHNPELGLGQTFVVNPQTESASNGHSLIPLKPTLRSKTCEDLL